MGLKLFALELRLDYMGTSVLMSRVSSLDVTLRDEWKINRSSSGDAFMPTRRYVLILIKVIVSMKKEKQFYFVKVNIKKQRINI